MPQTTRLKVTRQGAAARQEVAFWHASDAELWLGVFLFDEATPESDFTGIVSADLSVYASANSDAPLLISKSIDPEYFNELMTLEGWDNATDAPTLNFQLTEEDLNQPFRGQAVKLHYVVSFVTATSQQVLVAGDFILLRSFGSPTGGPPTPDLYYTQTQIDTLLASLGQGLGVVDDEGYVVLDGVGYKWPVVPAATPPGAILGGITVVDDEVYWTSLAGVSYKWPASPYTP